MTHPKWNSDSSQFLIPLSWKFLLNEEPNIINIISIFWEIYDRHFTQLVPIQPGSLQTGTSIACWFQTAAFLPDSSIFCFCQRNFFYFVVATTLWNTTRTVDQTQIASWVVRVKVAWVKRYFRKFVIKEKMCHVGMAQTPRRGSVDRRSCDKSRYCCENHRT